jgi:predicted glycogen debranching enzyme
MNFDLSREWLETNGIGGFASSTVVGCNTRRYHALLCAATQPPLGRMVLVNKADETLLLSDAASDERSFQLGCNQYPGVVHPAGYRFLREFQLDPLPRWIYEIPAEETGQGRVLLQKNLWMPHGQNATVLRYELLEGAALQLSLQPFLTARDYHGIHKAGGPPPVSRQEAMGANRCVCVTMREGAPQIAFSFNGDFYENGTWYYNLEYSVEPERGLEWHEDVWHPGTFVWHLAPDEDAWFVTATQPHDLAEMQATQNTEIERRAQIASAPAPRAQTLPAQTLLRRAADQFIVQRGDGLHTVLAGYPWFSDWGRDTMIALEGLSLVTERFEIARGVLLAFAGATSQGMIPNRFPDQGETPDYNTVDATLWFFHAIARYAEYSGDWETVRDELYPVLKECLDWHLWGTRYGIKADANDGMLHSGEAGTQLTWMDAKVGDWVVTPRHGKPVEIQALWFNALQIMHDFAARMQDDDTRHLCEQWSTLIRRNFRATFWNEAEECLYDNVNGDERDGALRPNQIFVVALPHALLERDDERKVVQAVGRDLLTPYGLRSLSPRDSRYQGHYGGDQAQRDGAYHQGTVWAWLMGPYLSAYLKVHDHSDEAKARAQQWLQPLLEHLEAEACLGSISEIFDGDAPHTPRGCFAQAWSVAEVLRVLDA